MRFNQIDLFLISQQNGIHAGNHRIHFVDFPKLITAGQLMKINCGFVRYIIQKLLFFPAETVDFNSGQIVPLRQTGILPEHGVTGIKDRSHTDEFQSMGIPKNAEIVQMPVGIGQNKVRQNLIFQERP